MEKLTMERRAYDNKYLHRDFHASMDNAIAYIADTFGESALDEYLARYVDTRYSIMTLSQLEQYFRDIYEKEEAQNVLETKLSGGKLTVNIERSPALDYLNANGGASKWYAKTTTTMYPLLAEKCGLGFDLSFYDEKTGRAQFTFFKPEE